jgi:hypothetical protein
MDKNIQLSYSGNGDDAWSASGSGVVGKVEAKKKAPAARKTITLR